MTNDVQKTARGIAWRADGPADAPPLVLLNSLGTTFEIWRAQVPVFAARFRVIRVDTRGHGYSDVPPGDYTLDDVGMDALSVLDAAGIERAHVCGVSLGGMTAMWLAAHAPERVRTLLPVSTALKIGVRATWDERIAQVGSGGTDSIAPSSMGRWFTEPFRAANPDIVAWCRAMLSSISADGYVRCCAILRDGDLHDVAARISAPTLVIVGTADPVTPPANADEIHQTIKGSRLTVLDASHICAVERPEEFNRAVLGFIDEQTARSR
jgi:3-oxoadipate enol-lactonase